MPGSGAPPQGQGPAGTAAQGDPQQAVSAFRALAQMVQTLAQKFPEGTQEASSILPLIQKWMARSVGDPNRVKSQQAPPNVA